MIRQLTRNGRNELLSDVAIVEIEVEDKHKLEMLVAVPPMYGVRV
jgi:hypothetical protein